MTKKKDNIINFPIGKDVKIDNTGGLVREHMMFTDNLTEGLVVNMIHNTVSYTHLTLPTKRIV